MPLTLKDVDAIHAFLRWLSPETLSELRNELRGYIGYGPECDNEIRCYIAAISAIERAREIEANREWEL